MSGRIDETPDGTRTSSQASPDQIEHTCPRCYGKGYTGWNSDYSRAKCRICAGTGFINGDTR